MLEAPKNEICVVITSTFYVFCQKVPKMCNKGQRVAYFCPIMAHIGKNGVISAYFA